MDFFLLSIYSKNESSHVLGNYLIEYNNSKRSANDLNSSDKDIVDHLRIRREVLPPMWDVFEKLKNGNNIINYINCKVVLMKN